MASPESDRFRANLRILVNGHQGAIAKLAKISRKHLNCILQGHANPTLEVASKLAKAVGRPLASLVSEETSAVA